jgi:hypothetical protein
MTAAMVGAALLVVWSPIPFWTPAISLAAISGSNIAICVITIAVSTLYDSHVRWAGNLPVSHGVGAAAAFLGRVVAGSGAAAIATGVQAVLLAIAAPEARGTTAGLAIGTSTLLCVWLMIVVLPWALLARNVLGALAAPWTLLALVVVAGWLPRSSSGAPRALSWVLPLVPIGPAPELLFRPSSWAYALAHAACVTVVAVAFFRQRR